MVRPIGANTNSHEPSDDPIEFAAPSQATRWGYDKVGILNAKIPVLIDEFRISSVARYKSDFQPPTSFEPDEHTLALYHCDEGKGDVLIDSSGNDHHGKIIEATWVSRLEADIPVVPRGSAVPAEPE